jgi:hypothetical protein
MAGIESSAKVGAGRWDQPAQRSERPALLGMRLVILLAEGEPDAGDDEEGAEDVDEPAEPLDQRGAAQDHPGPQHDGGQDPPEEDPVLVDGGDGEGVEEQDEDEEVVDRERLLDQVAGEELDRLPRPEPPPDPAVEEERQADPDARPAERVAGGDDLVLLVEHEEIDHQEEDDERDEARPEERRDGDVGHRVRNYPLPG